MSTCAKLALVGAEPNARWTQLVSIEVAGDNEGLGGQIDLGWGGRWGKGRYQGRKGWNQQSHAAPYSMGQAVKPNAEALKSVPTK